jgi:hypothetical protein
MAVDHQYETKLSLSNSFKSLPPIPNFNEMCSNFFHMKYTDEQTDIQYPKNGSFYALHAQNTYNCDSFNGIKQIFSVYSFYSHSWHDSLTLCLALGPP